MNLNPSGPTPEPTFDFGSGFLEKKQTNKLIPKCTVLHPKAPCQWADSCPVSEFRSLSVPCHTAYMFPKMVAYRGVAQPKRPRGLVKSWHFRSRCYWLLTSIRLSCCEQFSLKQNCFKVQMNSCALSIGTFTFCWQLSFLWGHQPTNSTCSCSACLYFPWELWSPCSCWPQLNFSENCFLVNADYLKADVQGETQDPHIQNIEGICVSKSQSTHSDSYVCRQKGGHVSTQSFPNAGWEAFCLQEA